MLKIKPLNHRRKNARIPAQRLKTIWHKHRRAILSIVAALMLLIVAGLIFLISSYRYYSKLVDARLAHGYLTSRTGIYAAPRTLRAGQRLSQDALVLLLRRSGYIETNASEVWSGSFVAAQVFSVENIQVTLEREFQ